MTFSYADAPPEYAEARRPLHRAILTLNPTPDPAPRLEQVIADARDAFKATVGLTDGTRSAQIVSWRRLLERTATKELCQ